MMVPNIVREYKHPHFRSDLDLEGTCKPIDEWYQEDTLYGYMGKC